MVREIKEAKAIQESIDKNKALPKGFRINNLLVDVDYSIQTKLIELSEDDAVRLLEEKFITGREGFFCLKSSKNFSPLLKYSMNGGLTITIYKKFLGSEYACTRVECFSSNASERYLRNMRPRTTCLYSAASILFRSLSASAQRVVSNPRFAAVDSSDFFARAKIQE